VWQWRGPGNRERVSLPGADGDRSSPGRWKSDTESGAVPVRKTLSGAVEPRRGPGWQSCVKPCESGRRGTRDLALGIGGLFASGDKVVWLKKLQLIWIFGKMSSRDSIGVL